MPAQRRRDEDDGFTLIELMVVVLIIAILIAIAIPSFMGARARAQDRQAQANLRNALTAQKTYYTDALTFSSDGATLAQVQGYLQWRNAAPADARDSEVAVADVGTGNGARVWMESKSASGQEYCIAELADQGTFFKDGAGCFADPTVVPLATSWHTGGF